MSLFSGGGKANSQTNRQILGYRIQTSIYGTGIPIVYGTARVPGSVIWTGDWQSHAAQSQGGKGGGKGSGGGKFGGGGGQSYTYTSAVIIALAQGPITAVLNVWLNKDKLRLSRGKDVFTIGATTYHPAQLPPIDANGPTLANDNGVAVVSPYSVVVNDPWSPGSTTLSGTQKIQLTKVNGAPGPGQYQLFYPPGSANPEYIFNAADVGKAIEIDYSWRQPTNSTSGDNLKDLTFELISGELGQAPWSWIAASKYADQALGYSEVAYLAGEAVDLGTSGMFPNYSFEIPGFAQFGGGVIDANPADVISDILLSVHYGAGHQVGSTVLGFTPADLPPNDNSALGQEGLGPFSEFWKYCTANGLFISPVLDGQQTLATWMQEWLTIGNCAPVGSEGVIKFRSYGDTTAIGGGVTFTPNTSPIYDLDDDAYISDGSSDPILMSRPSVRDAMNRQTVEWTNRANDYNLEPLNETDSWSVATYGLRPDTVQALHSICLQDVAQKVCSTLLKNSVYKRCQYTFTVGWQFALLEPMDLITISDPNYIGLRLPVRILSIEEDDQGQLKFLVEEFPWGVAGPTLHPKQVALSFGPGYFSDPGDIEVPIFFEATDEMTQGLLYTLMIPACGGPEWGGATVHAGTLDPVSQTINYEVIGVIMGPSTMGTLRSAYGSSPDPDTTDTLHVDLTESDGVLVSVDSEHQDNFTSLALIDQELIAYGAVTLMGSNRWDLAPPIRRGVYETIISPHDTGSQFAVMDGSVFAWQYQPGDVGREFYFKFTSFNRSGAMEQDLAAVPSYTYTLKGPRLPYPWEAGFEAPVSADPFYRSNNFGLQPSTTISETGDVLPVVTVLGNPPIGAFTALTKPPALLSLIAPAAGGVKSVTVGAGGTGYLQGQSGTFAVTFATGAAAGYAVVAAGVVTAVVVTKPGASYGSPPAVAFTGDPTGSGATATAVLSAGGTVAPGTYAAGFTALDAITDPGRTTLSNVREVIAPASSELVFTVQWPTGSFGGNVYVGSPDPSHGMHLESGFGLGGATTGIHVYELTSVSLSGLGAPDRTYDHLILRWRNVIHSGSWAEQVTSVGTNTLTFSTATFTTNQWANYYVSLLAFFDQTRQLIIWDAKVTSNTATTLTLDHNPSGIISIGDLITMRFKPTGVTSASLYDPNSVNCFEPSGFSAHSESGNVAWILAGTGAGQSNVILDNGNGAGGGPILFASPWATLPDSTSLIVIVDPQWSSEIHTHSSPMDRYTNFHGQVADVTLPNTPGVFVLQAITADADGSYDETYAPVREFYSFGTQGTRYITADATMKATDSLVEVDCSVGGANITYTLLDLTLIPNQLFIVEKVDSTAHTVTVLMSGTDTFTDGTTSVVLSAKGDSMTFRVHGG